MFRCKHLVTVLTVVVAAATATSGGSYLVFQKKLEQTLLESIGESTLLQSPCWNQTQNVTERTEIVSSFDGTLLESFDTSDVCGLQNAEDKLDAIGLRARQSLPPLCSANAWGYQDVATEKASDSVHDDDFRCQLELDEFFAFSAEYLQDKETTSCADQSSDQPHHKKSFLNHWRRLMSFGRVTADGTYTSFIWPGEYDKCLQTTASRYCLGLVSMKKRHADDMKTTNGHRVGLCVPDSCSSSSLRSRMDQLSNLLMFPRNKTSRRFELIDTYCLPTRDSPTRKLLSQPLATVTTTILVSWLLLVLIKSLKGTHDDTIWDQFNLRTNWTRFFAYSKHQDGKATILNCIKVIGMNWLVISHVFICMLAFLKNQTQPPANSVVLSPLLLSFNVVHVFFWISGFLVAEKYNTHKSGSRQPGILSILLNRYSRLFPMYFVVYLFVRLFAHKMADGPLWDYATAPASDSRHCTSESWSVPIFLLASLKAPNLHCIYNGWHVSSDLQIHIIVPMILFLYARSRTVGRLATCLLILVAHVSRILEFMESDLEASWLCASKPHIVGPKYLLVEHGFSYSAPIGRMSAFFSGFLIRDFLGKRFKFAGQIPVESVNRTKLNHLDRQKSEQLDASAQLTFHSKSARMQFAEFSFIVALVGLTFGFYIVAMGPRMSELYHELLGRLAHPMMFALFELGWSLLIYGLLRIYDDLPHRSPTFTAQSIYKAIVSFFTWPAWDVLVRLNYLLMLVHFVVVRYFVQSQRDLIQYSTPNLIQLQLLTLTTSYLISFILHLTIEIPLTAICQSLNNLTKNKI